MFLLFGLLDLFVARGLGVSGTALGAILVALAAAVAPERARLPRLRA
jgi:hypothetical protein